MNIDLAIQSLPALLRGALVSLQIAALSCSIGLTLGTLLALLHTSSNRLIKLLIYLYVTLIRGTPMLVQIFIVFYVLPQLGISFDKLWAATVAIGLNSAAYISTIIKAGIASVGNGQVEAAYVIGFSKLQTTRYIVLPQAIRVVLPALGNEFITLIKDSSLASTIGVVELLKEASIIKSQHFDAITVYTMITIIYLVMTTSLSIGINALEKRMNRNARA
jgi:polar amino acid transport system permease protein